MLYHKVPEKVEHIFHQSRKFTKKNHLGTVWKLQTFSVTQILCKIQVDKSRDSKAAILALLEALNFDFHQFLHFLKAEIYLMNEILSP